MRTAKVLSSLRIRDMSSLCSSTCTTVSIDSKTKGPGANVQPGPRQRCPQITPGQVSLRIVWSKDHFYTVNEGKHNKLIYVEWTFLPQLFPVSILHKLTAGRSRVDDGPITACCRFIKHATWENLDQSILSSRASGHFFIITMLYLYIFLFIYLMQAM